MCLKPYLDSRDGEYIRSRMGIERKCTLVYPDTNVYEATRKYFEILCDKDSTLKWILVDEAQFMTSKQINDLSRIVDDLEINVMCFGLRTDFTSSLFDGSKRLFEIADEFEEIKSSCQCGKKASINARVDDNGQLILLGSQIEVGGDEKYRSMCRKCWRKLINKIN